jgi:hypothetical protein
MMKQIRQIWTDRDAFERHILMPFSIVGAVVLTILLTTGVMR